MQRPRNRQPRPPRQQDIRPSYSSSRPPQSNQQRANGPVPTIQQVVPGASVSIVLKEDQPTGCETHGVVQDVLTKGNHPRGIKVRLRDGQVGRVQRMMAGGSSEETATTVAAAATAATRAPPATAGRFTMRYTDVRADDEFLEGPPPRSLADFFPEEPAPAADARAGKPAQGTAKCPICECFEGDEVAVSYHVEKEHLT